MTNHLHIPRDRYDVWLWRSETTWQHMGRSFGYESEEEALRDPEVRKHIDGAIAEGIHPETVIVKSSYHRHLITPLELDISEETQGDGS